MNSPDPTRSRHPSTADSRPEGEPVDGTDAPTGSPSETHAVVKGQASPRLPHERDESSDSGTTQSPRPKMEQARQDLESGKHQTDRGEATEETYRRNLRDTAPGTVRKGE